MTKNENKHWLRQPTHIHVETGVASSSIPITSPPINWSIYNTRQRKISINCWGEKTNKKTLKNTFFDGVYGGSLEFGAPKRVTPLVTFSQPHRWDELTLDSLVVVCSPDKSKIPKTSAKPARKLGLDRRAGNEVIIEKKSWEKCCNYTCSVVR